MNLKKELLIVVSRYNEDLNWLKDPLFHSYSVIIYNKGTNEDFYCPPNHTVVNLPNVGREGHTYLYHVVNHYEELDKITVFLPGSANMFPKFRITVQMMKEIEKNDSAVFLGNSVYLNHLYSFYLDQYGSSYDKNKELNPETRLTPSRIRPFGKWYNEVVKGPLTHLCYSGTISVERSDVLRRPKSFYESLLEEVGQSSNPEVGHYLERSWASIFSLKDTLIMNPR
jgi:hypothetical protein